MILMQWLQPVLPLAAGARAQTAKETLGEGTIASVEGPGQEITVAAPLKSAPVVTAKPRGRRANIKEARAAKGVSRKPLRRHSRKQPSPGKVGIMAGADGHGHAAQALLSQLVEATSGRHAKQCLTMTGLMALCRLALMMQMPSGLRSELC